MTAGERLRALSPLLSGTAAEHMLAVKIDTGPHVAGDVTLRTDAPNVLTSTAAAQCFIGDSAASCVISTSESV